MNEKNFHLQAAGHRLQARTLTSPGGVEAGDGPTLVFLHEGLGSIGQWKNFPCALVERTALPALLYDRYGYGGSDPLQEPRTSEYLKIEGEIFLPQVLQACRIEDPILVGHSDGGTVALLFAAAFPHWPRGVITEAAHLFLDHVSLEGIRRAVEIYPSLLREKLQRYHGEKTDSVFYAWSDTWLSPRFRDWNIEARLPAIVAPVLALQGEHDEYGTPGQLHAIAAGVSGPCTGRLIPGCGHVPHHQARDEVLEEMTRFVRGCLLDKARPRVAIE